MNKFLIVAAILATAFARPDGLLHDQDGHVSVVQNTIGTYKFNVHLRDSSRSEERFADGSVIGEYTTIDAHGIPQTFKYTAGKGGFRIIDGPLPIAPLPVAELPEIIAARAALPVSVVPVPAAPLPFSPLPLAPGGLHLPVEDTPEVRAAKSTFFAAFDQARSHIL